MTPSELLDLAWSCPLFEALYGRRSRRFGLGFEMPEGPFRVPSRFVLEFDEGGLRQG